MGPFISLAGGYLKNPEDSAVCQFCGVRSVDDLLAVNFNIYYDHHWRDIGVLAAFIMFNVRPFCSEVTSVFVSCKLTLIDIS